MSLATHVADMTVEDSVPREWTELCSRVKRLPDPVRRELEPLLAEALEEARFRGRVLSVAREALDRQRLDLELLRFDLDATRREREVLRRQVGRGTEIDGN